MSAEERGSLLSDDFILHEAERILAKARDEGIILRFLGGLAFDYHCNEYGHLRNLMARELTDIDFAAYSSQRSKIEEILRDLGYTTLSYVQIAAATLGRSLYWKKDFNQMKVDIFWDRLRMNHDLDFRGRLELDDPTIPLPELLLEKLQIVEINWKDVKDVIMLLREHDLGRGSGSREVLDLDYVTNLLSKDWGFYYTATKNLQTIQRQMAELDGLSEEDRSVVAQRLTDLMSAIESAPKSLKWKLRAKIGTKRIWYRPVDEAA